MIEIEKNIDNIIDYLESYFISKRTKTQSQLVHIQKNTNWKLHRKHFRTGFIVCLILFFFLLRVTVDVSKNPLSNNYKILGIILLFSALFSLLGAVLLISFYQFAAIWEDFRTYQDEILSLKKKIKKDLNSNAIYTNLFKDLKHDFSIDLSIAIVSNYLEFNITKIENNLKSVEPLSYLLSLLCLLFIFLVYESPDLINALTRDPKNYSILISILLFLIAVVQSIFKIIALKSGSSLIGKHQECLLLLKNIGIAKNSY